MLLVIIGINCLISNLALVSIVFKKLLCYRIKWCIIVFFYFPISVSFVWNVQCIKCLYEANSQMLGRVFCFIGQFSPCGYLLSSLFIYLLIVAIVMLLIMYFNVLNGLR